MHRGNELVSDAPSPILWLTLSWALPPPLQHTGIQWLLYIAVLMCTL